MESPEPEEWSENTSQIYVTGNGTGNDALKGSGGPGGGSLLSFAIAQPFIWFLMFFRWAHTPLVDLGLQTRSSFVVIVVVCRLSSRAG